NGSPGKHQGLFGFPQFASELPQTFLLDPAHPGGCGGGPRLERLNYLCGRRCPRQFLAQQQMAQRQRDRQLRAGTKWNPLIGALSRDRKPRLSLHQLSAHTRPPLTEMSELPRVVDRRCPATQEIRADSDGVGCVTKIV